MTKEKLKNLYLNEIKNYDPNLLMVLESNYLNDIINKINNAKKKEKKNDFLMEKFLFILNLIIIEFKNNFINLINEMNFIIEKIITTNEFEIIEMLFSINDIDNEDDDYYKKNVKKILINNFIRNTKLFPQLKRLLKKSKIKYKNINDYNYDELSKIVTLLSKLVFSSSNINNSISLFTYFNYEIYSVFLENKSASEIDLNKTKKSKIELIKIENKKFNELIDEYYYKKKYLKYFR